MRKLLRWLYYRQPWPNDPECYDGFALGGLIFVVKGYHPPVIWIGLLCVCFEWRGWRQRPYLSVDWNPL